ncbi:hypothetical protein [Oryzibacter oryziterrae]|uniref:hypothetical protein n=1 Tax=Oryzibacter oryziterrae TaxID=2766474 RepID=UPI001F23609E|nr:hypothetical protein [Oryzibacter oryziterrae]
MTKLRVYDEHDHLLALDLRDLLKLLAPRSLAARWTVAPVREADGEARFEATGEEGERLERLAQVGATVTGQELAAMAAKVGQVIWGEFVGMETTAPGSPWVIIRAIDSTCYEIETDDMAVLNKVKVTYRQVR